jgi:nucleotidyltransferase substrate binding protein (TIGR01987 family)
VATDFSTLEKALGNLESALQTPPRNDLERDGAIQRFEYTFELAWKVAKRVLEDSGVVATTPKSVIRELGSHGWIPNVEQWLEFLKARNASVHTYVEQTAIDVFRTASLFADKCRALIETLKKQ